MCSTAFKFAFKSRQHKLASCPARQSELLPILSWQQSVPPPRPIYPLFLAALRMIYTTPQHCHVRLGQLYTVSFATARCQMVGLKLSTWQICTIQLIITTIFLWSSTSKDWTYELETLEGRTPPSKSIRCHNLSLCMFVEWLSETCYDIKICLLSSSTSSWGPSVCPLRCWLRGRTAAWMIYHVAVMSMTAQTEIGEYFLL